VLCITLEFSAIKRSPSWHWSFKKILRKEIRINPPQLFTNIEQFKELVKIVRRTNGRD
jgi:hypothetical protein